MISAPVVSSRLPVGSSAIRIAGLGASARASATRCCSPPTARPGNGRASLKPTAIAHARHALRVLDAGELERHRDVFQRRHGRDQMERLEHDPDIAAAEARQRVLAERGERLARGHHGAGVRPFRARP